MSSIPRTEPQDDDKASLYSIDGLDRTEEEELKPFYSEHEPGTLHVPRDYGNSIVRLSSPDGFSEMSMEDRPSVQLLGPRHEQASKSLVQAKGSKGRLLAFWARNKGLCYVLLAQVFGTLMNVTTRCVSPSLHGRKIANSEKTPRNRRKQWKGYTSFPGLVCQDGHYSDFGFSLHVVESNSSFSIRSLWSAATPCC
jgi:hypothetical protein